MPQYFQNVIIFQPNEHKHPENTNQKATNARPNMLFPLSSWIKVGETKPAA